MVEAVCLGMLWLRPLFFRSAMFLKGLTIPRSYGKETRLLFDQIMEEAISIGIGIVGVDDIEVLNIKQASRLAMKLAIEKLHVAPDFLLVDAENMAVELPQSAIIHGDALSQSIAAASIIAKVTRDRMCLRMGRAVSRVWNRRT